MVSWRIAGKNRTQASRGGEPLVGLTACAQINLHVILTVQETVNNLGGERNETFRYRRYPVGRPVVPGLELLATRQVTSYEGRRRQGHLSAVGIDIAVAAADCRQCVINHAYTLRLRRIIKIAGEVGGRIVVERPAARSTHAYMLLLRVIRNSPIWALPIPVYLLPKVLISARRRRGGARPRGGTAGRGLPGRAARGSGGSGRAGGVTGGGIVRIWRLRNVSSMWRPASGAARCAGSRLSSWAPRTVSRS